ncbi:MAG TPA: acyl-CoA dehydrogenase family protein [Fontimonas sp.]
MGQMKQVSGADGMAPVVEKARALLPALADRAAALDADDGFVGDNYGLLKQAGLIEAGVPVELGGGGASVAELAEMLRVLAQGCSATALAFSMHTHQVAIPAWRWRNLKVAAVEPLLKRIATERIVLLSSGGSDWIAGSGEARKVDGGYRVKARKVFTSGAAAGDLLMTGALLRGPDGDAVIHFGLPMKAPEVKVLDNWRTLGMRATGSNDVVIDDYFVADAAVSFTRKAGEWHPVFQIIATVAFPLIYAVYVGIAERARNLAIGLAKGKPLRDDALLIAGRMDTALRGAQLAHRGMIEAVEDIAPSAESVNEVMIGRTLVAEQAIRTVELAMELAGGAGFYRAQGLERLFRDIQAARYHPLQPGPQARYAGAIALGLPTAQIY